MPPDDPERLAELLLEWEDRRAAGRPASPEALCSRMPHLVGPLRVRVAALRAIDRLLAAAPRGPGWRNDRSPC